MRISVNVLLADSIFCISVQQIYVRLYLLPTDCTSFGYNMCYCFCDIIWLIIIYILRETADGSKLLYFYY